MTDIKLSHLLSFLLAASGLAGKNEPNNKGAGLKEDISLSFELATVDSGRFSNRVQKNFQGTHALQVIREETTSSFILDLKPDGAVTVCRGWRYLAFNSGPQVNESQQINEQLGYSGKWYRKQNEEGLYIDIALDDSQCARVAEYSDLIPNHAVEWRLRCFPMILKGYPAIKEPILACQFIDMNMVFGEDHPHVIADSTFEGNWLLLGGENGLSIKVESTDINNNKLQKVQIESAPGLLPTDAWRHSF